MGVSSDIEARRLSSHIESMYGRYCCQHSNPSTSFGRTYLRANNLRFHNRVLVGVY